MRTLLMLLLLVGAGLLVAGAASPQLFVLALLGLLVLTGAAGAALAGMAPPGPRHLHH